MQYSDGLNNTERNQQASPEGPANHMCVKFCQKLKM